jgi:hypothetical protein
MENQVYVGVQVNFHFQKSQKWYHSCASQWEQKFAGEFHTQKWAEQTFIAKYL